MKKSLPLSLTALLCCLSLLLSGAALAADFPFTAIGGEGGAKVRSQPGPDGAVLGEVQEGELITVTGQTGSWYSLIFNGVRAYVSADRVFYFSDVVYNPVDAALAFLPEYAAEHYAAYPQAEAVEAYVSVGPRGANLRQAVWIDQEPLATLHAGTEVYVFCLLRVGSERWAVVRRGDDVGYVNADFLDWEDL